MYLAGKSQFYRRAGTRAAGGLLAGDGQERIRAGGRRPELVIQAHDPERIEVQAGAFQDAEDLDARFAPRLWLEQPAAAELGEALQGGREGQRAEQRIELPEFMAQGQESLLHLKLNRCECS